eukprot:gene11223-13749_t
MQPNSSPSPPQSTSNGASNNSNNGDGTTTTTTAGSRGVINNDNDMITTDNNSNSIETASLLSPKRVLTSLPSMTNYKELSHENSTSKDNGAIDSNNNNNNNNSSIDHDDKINNNNNNGGTESIINRYTPYASTLNHLTFQDKLEMVETVVSMFPLLEKDPAIYSILNRNGWKIDVCLTEFQRRHEHQEKKLERMKKISPGLYKQHPTHTTDDHHLLAEESDDLEDEFLDEEELDYEEEQLLMGGDDEMKDESGTGGVAAQRRRRLRQSRRKDTSTSSIEDSSETIMQDDNSTPTTNINNITNTNSSPPNDKHHHNNNNNGFEEESALNYSKFPNLKKDIQTLKDIFGTTYHEFELKGFYIVCGGNLESVIDQLVNEQVAKQQTDKQLPPSQPPQPRQPLTTRLSEEDKRQLQLQLIEEQEKLEKKFSDKKKQEIASHPSKKNFSQQEILAELKDLFGKNVDEGVIEWIAYSCEYDLGKAVTQLVDLKHNNLLKKGSLPSFDPSVQKQISNNLEILAKQNIESTFPTKLTAQDSINFESLVNEVQSKLFVPEERRTQNHLVNQHSPIWGTNNNNNSNNNNSISQPPTSTTSTTTTTTTTTTNKLKPDDTGSNLSPVFSQSFVYNPSQQHPDQK